jgi:hypothetical protein
VIPRDIKFVATLCMAFAEIVISISGANKLLHQGNKFIPFFEVSTPLIPFVKINCINNKAELCQKFIEFRHNIYDIILKDETSNLHVNLLRFRINIRKC